MYVCVYACMHAWMDGWMDGCLRACVRVCVCMYVCMYVCVYAHTHFACCLQVPITREFLALFYSQHPLEPVPEAALEHIDQVR